MYSRIIYAVYTVVKLAFGFRESPKVTGDEADCSSISLNNLRGNSLALLRNPGFIERSARDESQSLDVSMLDQTNHDKLRKLVFAGRLDRSRMTHPAPLPTP
jgi:hypothetical protein